MKELIKIAQQNQASAISNMSENNKKDKNPAAELLKSQAENKKAEAQKRKSQEEARPESREYKVIPPHK